MKNGNAPEARATAKCANRKLSRPESQFDKFRELDEAVACRAYELFESRGCEHGQDLADWLRAESEILQALRIKVIEGQDRLAVEAVIPSFGAEDIEISAEPRRLIINGRTDRTDGEEEENTFLREILARDRPFSLLPVDIDADENTLVKY